MTSSYHQNQSAQKEVTAPQVGNKDILVRLLSACNTFSGKDSSSLCCVVQDCSNKLNPRQFEFLCVRESAIMNSQSANPSWGISFNFNPKVYFNIYSVHFTSDCFEQTFHIEGASIKLITCAIPANWKLSAEGISAIRRCRASKQSLTFLKLWFLRGFSNRVTLTPSQRRAYKHLIFASFLRWSRLRVQIFSVRAI